MELNPFQSGRVFRFLFLGGAIALAGSSSAQQTPPAAKPTPAAAAMSASRAPMTAPLSQAEFNARKKELQKTKQVNKWPTKIKGQPGTLVVDLSVSECTWLGGKVVYWADCGTTSMKCVGANGREICITEIK